MFVLVTVLCVTLAGLVWQFSIVRERQKTLKEFDHKIMNVWTESDIVALGEVPSSIEGRDFTIPRLRRWMGDEGVAAVFCYKLDKEEEERLRRVFPEADIYAMERG